MHLSGNQRDGEHFMDSWEKHSADIIIQYYWFFYTYYKTESIVLASTCINTVYSCICVKFFLHEINKVEVEVNFMEWVSELV